jgi:hypothetical protein
MLRLVALVRTDVSEELIASFTGMTRIGELGTTLASVFPSSPFLVNLMKEAQSSSETPDLTRATRRNILEDASLRNYCTCTRVISTNVHSDISFINKNNLQMLKNYQ